MLFYVMSIVVIMLVLGQGSLAIMRGSMGLWL